MRMGNADVLQAAAALDVVDGGRIERAEAIPEDVAFWRLQQKGALAYAELGIDAERRERALLQNDIDAVGGAEIFKGGPLLTVEADELALIFANGAALGRRGRLLKLCAASDANRFHL